MMRKRIVVFLGGRSLGRSCNVLTVHRSTPQAALLVAWPAGTAVAVKIATAVVTAAKMTPRRKIKAYRIARLASSRATRSRHGRGERANARHSTHPPRRKALRRSTLGSSTERLSGVSVGQFEHRRLGLGRLDLEHPDVRQLVLFDLKHVNQRA